MFGNSFDFLFWDMPWWGLLLVMLVTTQLSIAAVTLYLHRSQAHLALELHPVLCHFFRFWVWVTTSMVTSQWVAIHRKHHAKCEAEEDPHSPKVEGFNKVMWQGSELYRAESKNAQTMADYGHGTPNDWLEHKLYGGRFNIVGVLMLLAVFVLLFGPIGITMWAVQMAWMPLHAAGGINAIGHYWGYRNWETKDASTNIVPWAIWVGGEELHNNHHAFPSSAKLSAKPWEFDIGWMWIQILAFFHLARVKKTIPKPIIDAGKEQLDMDSMRAILRTKMHVMANYANTVIKPVVKEECAEASRKMRRQLRRARRAMIREDVHLDDRAQRRIERALDNSSSIKTVYEFRQRLKQVWSERYPSNDGLLRAMQEWVQQAEQSGIDSLKEFAASLKGWQLNAV